MKKECCNLNEVIQEFYNFLKAYVLGKVKNKQVAEDIVQEVMIKLVEAHHKSPQVDNIKAWLFQVSRNTIFDYFKKHNIEANFDNDWKIESDDSNENSKVIVADYIIPMIEMLPSTYAVALKMSDIDNIPQKNIATKLGLGLSATKMRIQRARIKLKELFIECCDIEYDKNGAFAGCVIKKHCEPLHQITKNLESKSSS
ncbi:MULTISPECIES: sigma-70 family RNA polymerase sigma factor [unclassified Tenacibaculum]|uniref:sigma-70 family RNA polymerase sigma factor n=1 Tax=unclassified Tenacibaculum TaxID=2635139 RepID=UPI001F29F35A|nr:MULTISPECIES: sigma-70 family RNA polymerase sigma factor [unclassified Tenacibaculum]MCF2876526.1 sigma-70 family RNA polymerase sigma factor [Tenacibaculum sp. Cn5-1]MCF2936567.1 sigma-70 family RNA polymerase sigma factor [Tenacibaculum sp. Cn5-34]MCG7511840.1 sigma-70 family RNA polymerase sigma factor [Tenacibaculum sp. Cn5-46]